MEDESDMTGTHVSCTLAHYSFDLEKLPKLGIVKIKTPNEINEKSNYFQNEIIFNSNISTSALVSRILTSQIGNFHFGNQFGKLIFKLKMN